VIAGNVVHHGRDVVVWYSSGNRIMNNSIRHGRYGTHFMYSHGNHVEGNDYSWNTVGIFVMYSRDITIRANRIAHAGGAGGMGIGIKDSGNLDVHANSFFDDTVAIHLDSSPLTVGQRNNFTDNTIRLCATAIYFHSSQRDNYFHRNSFRDTTDLVRVGGGGDAMGVEWCGNHFDIYQGYDLDGDGVGDLPFELRRLTTTLVNRRSELLLFRGTPAFALVDLSSRVSPLYPPQLILRDPQPSMRPPTEARHGG
jgi:nitrous oxidase accessory protein